MYLKTLMVHRNKRPADCYPFLKDGGDDLMEADANILNMQ